MKIECNVIDAEAGTPTVIEYNDILYFQKIEIKVDQKPKHHKSGYGDNYLFGRR